VDYEHQAATVDTGSQSAGAVLRCCRENAHLSLEDVAEATKIGKNYLRALEADRYEELPSPVYLKGFLRIYATYLGLDPEALLKLLIGQNSQFSLDPPNQDKSLPKIISFNWQRLVLPALLLVALLIVALVMTPSSPERPRMTAPAPVAAVQPVISSVTKPVLVAVPQVDHKEELPEVAAIQSKPHDGFVVRMKVNRNSALSVTIDDAAPQGYALTSGDLIEWKAAHTIALDLSDAGSVEIDLNGVPQKVPSSQGKSAYIVLDAEGIRH
jgi:cytoskeletal protein RodZ